MRRSLRFHAVRTIAALLLTALISIDGAAAQSARLRSPQGGEARALVIGIDAYRSEPALKGALADAHDLEETLRRNGVTDLTALYDGAADRATILRSLDGLLARSRSGDLVILSIAGHGAQEPEHVKGSQPDGMDDVFILSGFDPATAAGTQQRILGSEFNHIISQFEARGVRVLFIADACHGGGLVRAVDPRAAQMSYRQAPRYTIKTDALKPIATAKDAFLNELNFVRTAFLAAVDRKTKVPEINIPGIEGLRGALSYAVARAFDGAADVNHDGQVTQQELFTYVQQVAYQLSDQRQHVVTVGSGPKNADSDVLFARTRAVINLDAPENARPRPATPSSAATLNAPAPSKAPPVSAKPARPLDTVRIAVLGNQRELLKEIEGRGASFEIVAPANNPDLVWDSASLDVLCGADVIARGIDKNDLPSVIDRVAAVKGFKRLATAAPQTVRVLPDDKIHRRDDRLDVQVSGVAQRSLLLFNIAGDGTVQQLYPFGSDPAIISTPDYKFPVVVREPFGSDQVVAITSAQRMSDLEQALKKLNQRRTAAEFYKLVERYAPSDARIGTSALYTSP